MDDIVRRLEAGWNAMDGSAFAAPVHIRSELEAPRGPLAGRHTARFTRVLTKEPSGWEIASLHNTLEASAGPPR